MNSMMIVFGVSCFLIGLFLNSIFDINKEHNQSYNDFLHQLKENGYKLIDNKGDDVTGNYDVDGNNEKKNFVFDLENMYYRLHTDPMPMPGVRNLNKEEIENLIYMENVNVRDIFQAMDKKRPSNQTCISMYMFNGYQGRALNLISILESKEDPPIHAINLEVLYPKKVRGEDNKTLKIKVNPVNVKSGYSLKVKKYIIINYISPITRKEKVRNLSGDLAIDLQIVYHELTNKNKIQNSNPVFF